MPELPEVETVVRYFSSRITGKVISQVKAENNYLKVFSGLNESEFQKKVIGQNIQKIWRRGKYIILDLNYGYITIHLRMTGRLLGELGPGDKPKHLTASIQFTDETGLYFLDYRKFGRLEYLQDLTSLDEKLGVEPLSKLFTIEYLIHVMGSKKRMIKPLLLDQSIIAGLGNIYVDEVLWLSKIHPETPCNEIPHDKLLVLRKTIKKVLKESIRHHGTTIINFSYGENQEGQYTSRLNIFGKAGANCPRCKTGIVTKIKVSQRGTHICERCQKK